MKTVTLPSMGRIDNRVTSVEASKGMAKQIDRRTFLEHTALAVSSLD